MDQQCDRAAAGSGHSRHLASLIVQNGVFGEEESSPLAEGSSQPRARELQNKLERRKKQKRDSARRVRGLQKQTLEDLKHTYDGHLRRKEKLKTQISRLGANAQYWESIMNTLKQMEIIPGHPRSSSPQAGGNAAGDSVIPDRAEVRNQTPPGDDCLEPAPTKPLSGKTSADVYATSPPPAAFTTSGSFSDYPDLTLDQRPADPLSPVPPVPMATASDRRSPSPRPSAPEGFDWMSHVSLEDVDLLDFLGDFIPPVGKDEASNNYSFGGNPRDLLLNETEFRAPIPVLDYCDSDVPVETKS